MSWREFNGQLATHQIVDHQVLPIIDHLEQELRRSGVVHIRRHQNGLDFRGLLYRPMIFRFRALAVVGRAKVRVQAHSSSGIAYSVSTLDYLVTSALIASGPAVLANRAGAGSIEVALTFALPMSLLSFATCWYAASRLGDYLREVLVHVRP